MQQTKIYTTGFFKGEAQNQFLKNLTQMAKNGWHVHTVTDEGSGRGSNHNSRYKVVYEKKEDQPEK